ncbi:MAG: multiubiquitin domain-containing protein [Chloroflexota bacterium]|nr:multiubiquitin domain-containing protein [Chloroflexota bacterium]
MNGATQIYVSGREYKVPGDVVGYEQIVKIWNELHEAEGKYIIGTPGIDYENDLKGEDGVLLPGKVVEVKDGTSFSVDPEHVS